MPSCSFITTLGLLSVIIALAHIPIAYAQSDKERLAKLEQVTKSKSSNVLNFSTDTFRKYIESAPRSYSLLVMLTADDSHCQPCGPMRVEFLKVAAEYSRLSSRRKASKPLFLAELKLSSADQKFLTDYSIEHVPLLYFFPAGRSSRYPSPLSESSPENYNVRKFGFGPNQIKDFVNQRSGSNLPVLRGGYQIPFVGPVKAFMPVILTVVGCCAAFAVFFRLYEYPMMWYFLVVLVYIFSVGGGHYSWIHQSPLAAVNQQGYYEFIAGGPRSQFVAEGFFVSATCVGISVLVILIQELPNVISVKGIQTGVGLSMWAMTAILILALLNLYTMKMPNYLVYSS